MLSCPETPPEEGTPGKDRRSPSRVVCPFGYLGTIFKMIPITQHLHNAIRNGLECECYPSPSLSDGEHHPGCRWAAYVAEIYKLERREEKVKAAHERSGKKFSKAHAELAK